MKKLLILKGNYLILCMLLGVSTAAWAVDTPEPGHHAMKHHPGHGSGHSHAEGGHHGPGAMALSGYWRHSLSQEQSVKIDQMHLELEKKMADLSAKITMVKVDLALLVTMDKPQQKAIDDKIDKLASLKKQKMKSRYAHILKMRQVLTEQQRLSFDMGIMKKAKRKSDSRHH